MTLLQSLDPRVSRLQIGQWPDQFTAPGHDQFETYEVFQQVKEGKPFEHTGIVHAPDPELAFVFGKEQYSRRGNTCLAMAIAPTSQVFVSPYTEADQSALALFNDYGGETTGTAEAYEVFILKKRGKQHVHLAQVQAVNPEQAAHLAAQQNPSLLCYNVWVIKNTSLLFTDQEDKDIWNTLIEKKYREAIAYKAADKIARFKATQTN